MAIFAHIFSTEHSGSSAYGKYKKFINKAIEQANESGEDELVMILADYFSMASLVPFYSECTHKKKLNNKIKPVFGLKLTVQADNSIEFKLSDGDYWIDSKNRLIKNLKNEYQIILDECNFTLDKDTELATISYKKEVVIEDGVLTESGRKLISEYNSYTEKKPLFDKDHDLIVVAKNEEGRQNINKLISLGYQIELDSDYKRVNFKEFKNNSNGLILITGGKLGAIEDAILNDDFELALKRLNKFEEVFEKEDIYLQIQRVENTIIGQENEEKIIKGFSNLETEHGFQLFACNDVRFPDKENYKEVILRKKAMDKKVLYDPSDNIDFTEEQYLKPVKEMIALFSDYPQAIANTVRMTNKTDLSNYQNELYQSYLPVFPIPDEFNNLEGIKPEILEMEEGKKKEKEIVDFKASKYLRHLVYKGLEEREADIRANQNIYLGEKTTKGELVTEGFWEEYKKKYIDEIELELEVIHRTGFPGYFLIVQDVVQWCKNNDIPVGPGRGSGAGSIVLYCLKITEIDSIEYDLLFERFLNPERVGEPDIDMDFSPRQRQKVIKYVAERYGKENTAQILTHGTMAAKDVIDNIGRVMNLQPEERNRIKDLIPAEPGIKLKDVLDEDSGVEALIKLRKESLIVDMILTSALELEGSVKSYGKHAGGVVVSYGAMPKYAGLYQESKEQGVTEDESLLEELNENGEDIVVPIVQTDKHECEVVGLIKFDFLGLKNLDIIDDTIKAVNVGRTEENKLVANRISPQDKLALNLFKKSDTFGVFQFESPSMRRLMKDIKPDCFAEVVALVALFRPGPLNSGMAASFVNRKNGEEKLEYPHRDLEELLSDTYGTIIYQEQVMQVSRILSGFTRGEADTLRKAMGKKIFELMQKMRQLFAIGAGHKYCKETLELTSKKFVSKVDSSKKLAINIDLTDFPYKEIMSKVFTDDFDQESIDKNIEKFGFNGTFISTKEQIFTIFKEFNVISEDELEELDVRIDTMKDSEFFSEFNSKFIENGLKYFQEKNYSKEEAELLTTRLLVSCSMFVRFNKIFSNMNEFAAYGFNKSHSVAYAYVAMQTAYLKAHYPSQYMASLISGDGKIEVQSRTANECRRMGLIINKPNINKSKKMFIAKSPLQTEKEIEFGLGCIRGIAKKAQPIIDLVEKNGAINDIFEFYKLFSNYKTREVVKKKGIVKEQSAKVLNKTVFNSLLNSGALDVLCPDNDDNNRAMLFATFNHISETLGDLEKRLKKNKTVIIRNLKKLDFDMIKRSYPTDLNDFIDVNDCESQQEFINKVEDMLVPNDFMSFEVNKILQFYKYIQKELLNKNGGLKNEKFEKGLKELGISSIDDNLTENILNKSANLFEGELFDKLKDLTPYMLYIHANNFIQKQNKEIEKTETAIRRKPLKDAAKEKAKKDALKETLSILTSNNEYIVLNNLIKEQLLEKLIFGDKGFEELAKLKENKKMKEADIKKAEKLKIKEFNLLELMPIFSINEESKASHGDEEIEFVKKTVNGLTNLYVVPKSSDYEVCPQKNTPERSKLEYSLTGMYQTTHPLKMKNKDKKKSVQAELQSRGFNIYPLNNLYSIVKQKGKQSKNGKYYLDCKIATTIVDIDYKRVFNKKTERMETKVQLKMDDGTGIVTVGFAAEDIFSSGREDVGIKMLKDMMDKKSEILLIEGSASQGAFESAGAYIIAKKIGALNPDLYLPVEQSDFNTVEEKQVVKASPKQISWIKSLLRKKNVDEKEVLKENDLKSFDDLTIDLASTLITLYK